jgi:hypothetical protein
MMTPDALTCRLTIFMLYYSVESFSYQALAAVSGVEESQVCHPVNDVVMQGHQGV